MSVTAVPLRPLTRGTVPKLWIGIVLLVLFGAGLAWLGTRSIGAAAAPSWVQGNDGLRYAVWQPGRGAPITPDDVIFGEFEQHDPTGKLIASTALAEPGRPLTIESLPPVLRPVVQQMREGGAYQIQAPLRLWLPPGAQSPNSRWNLDDMLETRVKINTVLRGGAELLEQMQEEQMMRQQMIQQQMQQMQGRRGGGAGSAAGEGADVPTPGAAPAPAPRGRR